MKHYNIPIFIPHEGCPHDCVFCNQRKITGLDTSVSKEDIINIIEKHLITLPSENAEIEAAFFGGSFTGISAKKQEEFLGVAYEYIKAGKIHGIRLSTRPDCISEEIMDRLIRYGVTSVELGVQSMDDDVLLASNRGHTVQDVSDAVRIIRNYSVALGLQMMTGLPCDTEEKSIKTARKIIDLKPDFVRIYPTITLRGTYLEYLYNSGEYTPQTLSEAVNLCKKLLVLFGENCIPVIRVSLLSTDEISPEGSVVAGPYHESFRELCEGELYYDKIYKLVKKENANTFLVNPSELSKAIGNRRRNIDRIKQEFDIEIKFIADSSIEKGDIKIWKE